MHQNIIYLYFSVLLWFGAALYPKQILQASGAMNGLLTSNLVLAVLTLFFRLVILYSKNKGNKSYKVDTPVTTVVEEN